MGAAATGDDRAKSLLKRTGALCQRILTISKRCEDMKEGRHMNDQERYKRARARVQELRFFYTHVAVYVCVNIFLLLINLLTDPWNLWFYWPLLGWGIGLAVHAFFVFGFGGTMGRKWEEQKIREIMEQERETAPVDR